MPGPGFIEEYGSSDSQKRIDIMLNYFEDFPVIMEGQRKILVYKIKNELEYQRKQYQNDHAMVRLLQTLSDPTAKEAIENVMIEDVVLNGKDISDLVCDMKKGTKSFFCRQLYVLEKMQEEYTILRTQMLLLSSSEKKIFELYAKSGHDFQKIAEEQGIQLESARRRVWEIRKKIRKNTVDYMLEKI